MEEDGSTGQLSKKMLSSMRRMRRKITRNLGGIREMNGMPGAMVVVDPAREANAVREARRMGVAVIGVLDTDCDPESVDIVIPGNDDALKSVRLLVEQLGTSVEEGSANHRERLASMGVAEKRDEALAPGDEPRPTRGQRLPEGMSTRIAGGGKAAALLDAEDEGEGLAPGLAGRVAKLGEEEP
jgi:small subunit ribosomal protein S2